MPLNLKWKNAVSGQTPKGRAAPKGEFVSYEYQAGLISKCTGNLLLNHPESYPFLFLIRIYLPSAIQCLEKLQAQLCFEIRLAESQTLHHVSAI
jgi:hypothetical protein